MYNVTYTVINRVNTVKIYADGYTVEGSIITFTDKGKFVRAFSLFHLIHFEEGED